MKDKVIFTWSDERVMVTEETYNKLKQIAEDKESYVAVQGLSICLECNFIDITSSFYGDWQFDDFRIMCPECKSENIHNINMGKIK